MRNETNHPMRKAGLICLFLFCAVLLTGCGSKHELVGHTSCDRCGDIQVSFTFNEKENLITDLRIDFQAERHYLSGIDYPEGEAEPQCAVKDHWEGDKDAHCGVGGSTSIYSKRDTPNSGGAILDIVRLDREYAYGYLSFVEIGAMGDPDRIVDFGVMEIVLASNEKNVPPDWQERLHASDPGLTAVDLIPFADMTLEEEYGILNYVFKASSLYNEKTHKGDRPWLDPLLDPAEAYAQYADHNGETRWLNGAQKLMQGEFLDTPTKRIFQDAHGKTVDIEDRLRVFYWLYHNENLSTEIKREAAVTLKEYCKTHGVSFYASLAAYHWLKDSGLMSPEEEKELCLSALRHATDETAVKHCEEYLREMFALLNLEEAMELVDQQYETNFNITYGAWSPLDKYYWEKLDEEGGLTLDYLRQLSSMSDPPDWIFRHALESIPTEERFQALKNLYTDEDVPMNNRIIRNYLSGTELKDFDLIIDWINERFPEAPATQRYLAVYWLYPSDDCDALLRTFDILSRHFDLEEIDAGRNRFEKYSLTHDPNFSIDDFAGIEDVIAEGPLLDSLPEGKLLVMDLGKKDLALIAGLYTPRDGVTEIPQERIPKDLEDADLAVVLYKQAGEAHEFLGFNTGINPSSGELTIYDCVTSAVVYDFRTGEALGVLGSYVSTPPSSISDWNSGSGVYYQDISAVLDWLKQFY